MAKQGREIVHSVDAVWRAGLCTGCGTCESSCPEGAVIIRRHPRKGVYFPIVAHDRCGRCGRCLHVCPGGGVDFDAIASEFLDGRDRDGLIGVFDGLYVGHAASNEIRYNSASGGLVSSLLIYALDRKLIDGALVVTMAASDPLETAPCLATTPEQILSASGSKYCPSATNTGLRHILVCPGRFAVVGLPCQIHALRKWQSISPELREKVPFAFGLFCVNNTTYLGTEYILRYRGIDPNSVAEIRYRAEGWPGKIRVALRNGIVIIIPRASTEKKWYRKALVTSAFHYDFMVPRCLLCADLTAELADLSFGDPWLPEYKRVERVGRSLVIARSRAGSRLLRAAVDEGVVHLQAVGLALVRRAQDYSFKRAVGARLQMRSFLHLPVPDYGKRDLAFSAKDLIAALRYMPSYFSHHRRLWPAIYIGALLYYRLAADAAFAKRILHFALRMTGLRRPSSLQGNDETSLDASAPLYRGETEGTRILLIGAPLSRNLGGPSLFETTRLVLDSVFGRTQYAFISPLAEDIALADCYGTVIMTAVPVRELLVAALRRRLFGRTTGLPAVRRVLEAYVQADLVVDIWGIGFSDTIKKGSFRTSLLSGGRFLVGKILGKPVVKYTADLGPFESWWNRLFSRFYFNHTVDLILARSETTKDRLVRIGVRTPIIVCPDTAFLLPAEPCAFAHSLAMEKSHRPLVGFSVSHMAARQAKDIDRYVHQLAHLADHVVRTTGARILFLPNELSEDPSADDAYFSQVVLETMEEKANATIVPSRELTARELKSVIGQCDVVVATRYHTIVASLSQAVPVLAIGWHAKYEGVMGLVGQERYVCSVRSTTLEELKAKFDELWEGRNQIRSQIEAALPRIKEGIMVGAVAVVSLLGKKRRSRGLDDQRTVTT